MSNNNETNSFTSGPILSPFLKFTFPILISMFLPVSYTHLDVYKRQPPVLIMNAAPFIHLMPKEHKSLSSP